MANDLNQCNFIGRLGQDPETAYLPSGDAVTNISIAVGWKGKDKEGTEWVPVVAFGKLAEIMGQYLSKGSQVFISGRFKTDKWEDQQGQTRYKSQVVADKMQMLGSKSDGQNSSAPPQGRQQSAPQQQPTQNFDQFDDGTIPF